MIAAADETRRRVAVVAAAPARYLKISITNLSLFLFDDVDESEWEGREGDTERYVHNCALLG